MDATTGRDRIVQAAAARFLDHGFQATTLRDIAADVGIRAGSIYYHFASKDELLTEVLTAGVAAMEQAFDEVAASHADADGPVAPDQRLRAHVGAHLAVLFARGAVTAANVTAFRTLPSHLRAALVPVRDAYDQRWHALLSELRRDGQLTSTLDLTLLRLTLMGAMNYAVEWFDPDRGNLDELVEVVTRQFWEGARSGDRSTRPTGTPTPRSTGP